MAVIARLFRNGNLHIAGQLYTTETSFDDNEIIDDTTLLDDTYVFDTTNEFDTFFSYLFSLTISQLNVDTFRIDSHGNLITPQLNQSASNININNNKHLSITGVLTENTSF